jgi:hypothetical protein
MLKQAANTNKDPHIIHSLHFLVKEAERSGNVDLRRILKAALNLASGKFEKSSLLVRDAESILNFLTHYNEASVQTRALFLQAIEDKKV